MTPEKIKQRIKEIEKIKDDDEQAHIKEDELWFEVLLAIAEGHEEARGLATEAIQTRFVKFHRWCS
jgi:hypothetical protein